MIANIVFASRGRRLAIATKGSKESASGFSEARTENSSQEAWRARTRAKAARCEPCKCLLHSAASILEIKVSPTPRLPALRFLAMRGNPVQANADSSVPERSSGMSHILHKERELTLILLDSSDGRLTVTEHVEWRQASALRERHSQKNLEQEKQSKKFGLVRALVLA